MVAYGSRSSRHGTARYATTSPWNATAVDAAAHGPTHDATTANATVNAHATAYGSTYDAAQADAYAITHVAANAAADAHVAAHATTHAAIDVAAQANAHAVTYGTADGWYAYATTHEQHAAPADHGNAPVAANEHGHAAKQHATSADHGHAPVADALTTYELRYGHAATRYEQPNEPDEHATPEHHGHG